MTNTTTPKDNNQVISNTDIKYKRTKKRKEEYEQKRKREN
jgi:hypothetical protein